MEITVIASSSNGNAYLVKDGGTEVLIECGIQFKKLQQALEFRISSLDACLVSHSHKDHSMSALKLLDAGCPVFMSKNTKDELSLTHYGLKVITAGDWFLLGTLRVLPLAMVHDIPCLGFYMLNQDGEALLFATDTSCVPYRFDRIDHLMIECNYSSALLEADESCTIKDRIRKTHMSLSGLIRYLQDENLECVREIVIMHLSDSHSDEALFKRIIEESVGRPVTVAKK